MVFNKTHNQTVLKELVFFSCFFLFCTILNLYLDFPTADSPEIKSVSKRIQVPTLFLFYLKEPT